MAFEWIVVHDGSAGGDKALALECKRCGDIHRFSLPVKTPVFLMAARLFVKLHGKCKARPEEGS